MAQTPICKPLQIGVKAPLSINPEHTPALPPPLPVSSTGTAKPVEVLPVAVFYQGKIPGKIV